MMGTYCPRVLVAVLILAVAFCAGADQRGYEVSGAQFELVPAGALDVGKGHVDALKESAAKEGFFNKMFGTDCWSQALGVVEGQCKRLSSEQQARLAVALFNCHMRQAGRHTVKCTPESSIRECTEHMDNTHFIIYSNFMQHVESMCLFIQNQDFNAYTEQLINTLHTATKDAAESLSSVLSKLLSQEVTLSEMEAALGGVAISQSQVAESVAEAAEGVQRLEHHSAAITAQLETSVAQGDVLLRKQKDVSQGLAALEAQERAAADAALRQWRVAEERAEALAVSQLRYTQQQDRMMQETRMLSEHTAGLRSAVDVVLDYERRSDRLMLLMLGRSYTVEDIMFYASALVVGLFATAARATRGARLPGLLLLASTLVAERLAVSSNSSLLEADEQGNVMLLLPSPAAVINFARSGDTAHISAEGLEFTAVDYKWLVRRVWLSAGFALLVHCYFMYRNYERESYLLLRKVEGRLQEGQAALLESLAGLGRRMDSQHAELRRGLLADVDSLLHSHPALSPARHMSEGFSPSVLRAPGSGNQSQALLPLDRFPSSQSPAGQPTAQAQPAQPAPLPFLRRLFSASFAGPNPPSPSLSSPGQQMGERVMSSPFPAVDLPNRGSSPTAPYPPAPTLIRIAPTHLSTLRPPELATSLLPQAAAAHRHPPPSAEAVVSSANAVGDADKESRGVKEFAARVESRGMVSSTAAAGGKRRKAAGEDGEVGARAAKQIRPDTPASLPDNGPTTEAERRLSAVVGSPSRKRDRSDAAEEQPAAASRTLRPRRSSHLQSSTER